GSAIVKHVRAEARQRHEIDEKYDRIFPVAVHLLKPADGAQPVLPPWLALGRPHNVRVQYRAARARSRPRLFIADSLERRQPLILYIAVLLNVRRELLFLGEMLEPQAVAVGCGQLPRHPKIR